MSATRIRIRLLGATIGVAVLFGWYQWDLRTRDALETLKHMNVCIPAVCRDFTFNDPHDAYRHDACRNQVRHPDALAACVAIHPVHLDVHVFWHGYKCDDNHLVLFKSLILAHNTAYLRVIVWLLDDATCLRGIFPNIEFRLFRASAELPSGYTNLTARMELAMTHNGAFIPHDIKSIYSDMIRWAVLVKYGGLYLDVDCVVLRDLTPLLHVRPFAYNWGHKPFWNTAIFGMAQQDPLMARIFRTLLDAQDQRKELEWNLFYPPATAPVAKAMGVPFLLLSVHIFDPIWLRGDGTDVPHSKLPPTALAGHNAQLFEKAFAPRPSSLADMAPGAFVFHFHGQFRLVAAKGSYAELIHKQYDALYSVAPPIVVE